MTISQKPKKKKGKKASSTGRIEGQLDNSGRDFVHSQVYDNVHDMGNGDCIGFSVKRDNHHKIYLPNEDVKAFAKRTIEENKLVFDRLAKL